MNNSYRETFLVQTLLKPFEWLYTGITNSRNLGYSKRVFSIEKFPVKVISVGNITVGGTGKTPTIEFLANHFSQNTSIAILSRGYGRKTKGVVVANTTSTAEDIGDEPLQFYQKFGGKIPVVVAEKRVLGAAEILKSFPETKLILLDDAYQHRAIYRDANILLMDYKRPIYKDTPFPTGNLRESKSGINRADLVIITKAPADDASGIAQMKSELAKYTFPNTPIYVSNIVYKELVAFSQLNKAIKQWIVLSGIAQNKPFQMYVSDKYTVYKTISMPDHHHYTLADLPELDETTGILTTEKDMVKLLPLAKEKGITHQMAYVPIAHEIQNQEQFFTDLKKLIQ